MSKLLAPTTPPSSLKTIPHSYIAIEGNIGAGKTTLCKMLERDYGAKIILEQFTDNPFLPYFYENPDRYGFQVELFFMTERHKQLQEVLAQRSLFDNLMVSDYYFIKTLLFAKNNLKDEEFRLFQRLFTVLNTTFRKPDLLVYLHRPVEVLIKNIEARGREMETQIKADYLVSLQKAYFDYFRTVNNTPVLLLDVGEHNFWQDTNAYQRILEILQSEQYFLGVQHQKL